jgi:electron transfer flavoprotein beta subunit
VCNVVACALLEAFGARYAGVSPPVVVACMKRVELRAAVDPLTGEVIPDPASAGPSPADTAALEWALRIAEASGAGAVVASAGGPECDEMLRGAIAAGAARAVRAPLSGDATDWDAPSARDAPSAWDAPSARDAPSAWDAPSAMVARALARAVGYVASGNSAVVVCCGDASVDRGSGSVPAFLAGELAIPQALGLVGVSLAAWAPAGGPGSLEVERRLDRGRRERLRLRPPCVISVEAGTTRLRRASLQRSLASRQAVVEVLALEQAGSKERVELVSFAPYRPRTRVVPPPEPGLDPRARIAVLTGALHEPPAARTLVLGAEAAADELLSTLAEWGELPSGVIVASPGLGDGPEGPELPAVAAAEADHPEAL